MNTREIFAQIFGLIGLVIIVWSFQCKKNRNFFLLQGIGSFAFVLNFILINAYAGALFNLTNLVRGLLFSKEDRKVWKLVLVMTLYTACFAVSSFLSWGNWFMIFIASLPFVTLLIMSVLMWLSNGKYIRYFQVTLMSPAWIIHNIFNFSLGGILCESFNMISTIISFIRYGKDGFENKQ